MREELSSIDDEKAKLEEQIRAKRQRTELAEETAAVKIELMEQVLDLFEKRHELESQLRALEIEKAKFAAEYGNCGTLEELFERFGRSISRI